MNNYHIALQNTRRCFYSASKSSVPESNKLGAPPQTLIIGSHSAFAMCVHPTFFDPATPLRTRRR